MFYIIQEVMKKKIFLTYLFNFIGGIFSILLMLSFNIFTIYFIVVGQDNPTINSAYVMLFIGIVGLILFVTIVGKKMIQWIIIDETHITARCLYGVIKKIKWDDVEEIVFQRFDIGSPGIKSGWFIFVEEGTNLYQRNGVITNDNYITLKYNRKTLKTVKSYWNKKIINLND